MLVERGLARDSRQAQALLLAGQVLVGSGDGARRDRKAGDLVDRSAELELAKRGRYVSRGGEKLEAALRAFNIDPTGWVCLDVGASTGGFTDCLLQHGAARVYALDVGRGQLAESLRSDARVVSLERTHAARLDPSHERPLTLPEKVRLTVIDVSFISLRRVLPGVPAQLEPDGQVVALVKPQFELPPERAPGGVVRDEQARLAALDDVRAAAATLGLAEAGVIESPLRGPAGNRELLLWLVQA